jgi:hypothetical protein
VTAMCLPLSLFIRTSFFLMSGHYLTLRNRAKRERKRRRLLSTNPLPLSLSAQQAARSVSPASNFVRSEHVGGLWRPCSRLLNPWQVFLFDASTGEQMQLVSPSIQLFVLFVCLFSPRCERRQ